MNNTRFFAGILAALVATLATPSSRAAYVPGVTINAVTSEFASTTDPRRATNVVNEIGVFGDFMTATPAGTMWFTTNNTGAKPGTNAITFDLGSVHPLKAMHVWNYNEVNLVRRGMGRADISVAGEDLVFTTNLTDAVFAAAPGLFTNNFMQAFDFGGISARYVRISVRTNHGELGVDPGVGLSKVRFIDTNVPPRLNLATWNYSSNKVTAYFSESVTTTTATNPANYAIQTSGTNSAAILGLSMDLFNNRVMLQTSPLTNSSYALVASGVTAVSDGTAITNNSTVTIEPEVVLWLHAGAGVTTDGGGLVSAWADQSSAGNNALQANSVFQPSLVAGAINGQPVVRFNGAAGFTNFLEVPHSSTTRFPSGDMSVFVVMNFQTFNTFNTIISKVNTNNSQGQPAPLDSYVRSSPSGQISFLRGSGWGNNTVNGLTNIVTGQSYVISYVARGTNGTEYLNGAFNGSVATVTGVADQGTSFNIGARAAPFFGTKLNGDIAEIMVIRGAASDSERLAIHSYLGSKYGISIISLVFNQQPTNTTKLEGQTATFRVNVTANSPNIVYQWQRYGTNLPNATNVSYTTPLLTQADNNSTFRVQVSIPGNSQFSDAATLTVLPDTELPTVISAGRRIWSPSEIVVVYSESMLASTATNISNYVLDNGAAVTGTAIGDSPNRVVLTTTGLTNGGSYSLIVQNVKDLYNNTIVTALINIGIHPVPALWLRADQGVITNASGFVTEWDDQSGNANHATPFGGDETLPLLTNGFNNAPVLRFGYTDVALTTNYLACNPSESLALVGDMSMYCIASFVDYGNHRTLVSKATLNQAAPFDAYMLSGTGQQRLVRGNGTASSIITGTAAPSVKTPHVVYSTSKDNFVSHYLDGVTNGTGTVNLTPADSGSYLFIGHRFTDGATTMKGDIAELLLFGTSLSDADCAAMDLYFAGKYNLVIGAVPRLSLALTNNNSLVLSWPTPTVSFGLESASDLSGAPWNAVTNSVTSSGGTNSVVVTAGGIQQYYRLHKQ